MDKRVNELRDRLWKKKAALQQKESLPVSGRRRPPGSRGPPPLEPRPGALQAEGLLPRTERGPPVLPGGWSGASLGRCRARP